MLHLANCIDMSPYDLNVSSSAAAINYRWADKSRLTSLFWYHDLFTDPLPTENNIY